MLCSPDGHAAAGGLSNVSARVMIRLLGLNIPLGHVPERARARREGSSQLWSALPGGLCFDGLSRLLNGAISAHATGIVADETIAVGTPVARRPPHRSERAELAHSALALGAEAESHTGIGVRDAGEG